MGGVERMTEIKTRSGEENSEKMFQVVYLENNTWFPTGPF